VASSHVVCGGADVLATITGFLMWILYVHLIYHTVAYLLKVNTVEAEKQPLLGNARTQNRGGVTIRDAYSRCYVAPAAYACAVTSHKNIRGDAGGVLSWSAPRLYDSTDRVRFSE
jgi:hypothetical protein